MLPILNPWLANPWSRSAVSLWMLSAGVSSLLALRFAQTLLPPRRAVAVASEGDGEIVEDAPVAAPAARPGMGGDAPAAGREKAVLPRRRIRKVLR